MNTYESIGSVTTNWPPSYFGTSLWVWRGL